MVILVAGHMGQVGRYLIRHAGAPATRGMDIVNGPDQDICRMANCRYKADVVIHLAARIDVAESMRDPGPTIATNVQGTRNLREANPDARFIFTSSAAVYGDQPCPVREASPTQPLSPYGQSKLDGEAILHGETIFRPFNIYSSIHDASSPYSGIITKFIQAAQGNEPLRIFGDGEQTRDFIHASDVARAIWHAVDHPEMDGQAYNLATGKPTRIVDLAELIIDLTDSSSEIQCHARRDGDIVHSWADISKLRATGWAPTMDLRTGLEETLSPQLEENDGEQP